MTPLSGVGGASGLLGLKILRGQGKRDRTGAGNMSFSNRPNLVSKARTETKITHMNHSIVKALPQVIYGDMGM
jgi:hypothetical protein